MDDPARSKIHRTFYIMPILVLGAFLRLLLIGYKSLWADEGITWYMALGEIQQDTHWLVHYLYLWSIDLFGWNEAAGRLPSALFGWLSIPLVYAFGNAFFDRRFALYGAFITAISPYLIGLSQEMRIYSFLGLEIWLALFCFLHILKEGQDDQKYWITLLIVGIIGQYTHCFFLFILFYFALVLIIKTGRRGWKIWGKFILLIFAVLLLSIPQLIQTFTVTEERKHIIAADFSHYLANIYRVFRAYFCFVFGEFLTNRPGSVIPFLRTHLLHFIAAFAMVIVWISMVFLGLQEFIKAIKKKDHLLWTGKTILGLLVLFTLFFFLIDTSTSAHLVFLYVPFVLIIISFFTYHNGWLKNKIVLAFLLLTFIALTDYYQTPYFAYDRSDWKGAASLLKQRIQSEDAVLIQGSRVAYYTLKFYHPELDDNAYYLPRHDPNFKEGDAQWNWWWKTSFNEKILTLLNEYPRVWLAETNWDWEVDSELRAVYDADTWNYGDDLQVHLLKRRTEDSNP